MRALLGALIHYCSAPAKLFNVCRCGPDKPPAVRGLGVLPDNPNPAPLPRSRGPFPTHLPRRTLGSSVKQAVWATPSRQGHPFPRSLPRFGRLDDDYCAVLRRVEVDRAASTASEKAAFSNKRARSMPPEKINIVWYRVAEKDRGDSYVGNELTEACKLIKRGVSMRVVIADACPQKYLWPYVGPHLAFSHSTLGAEAGCCPKKASRSFFRAACGSRSNVVAIMSVRISPRARWSRLDRA